MRYFIKRKSLLLLITVVTSVNSSAQNITIQELVWTNAVTDSGAAKRFMDSIPYGEVGVWVKAKCNPSAFETLKSNGCLPIRYKWFKLTGTYWTQKGVDKPDDKFRFETDPAPDSVGITNRDFYWHSWCVRKKSKMSEGSWKIIIMTANNQTKLAEAQIKVTGSHE